MKKWNIGNRVTRKTYSDDGTWAREGDDCLADSPLRHGIVIARSTERDDELSVRWDDGMVSRYLDHGVDAE